MSLPSSLPTRTTAARTLPRCSSCVAGVVTPYTPTSQRPMRGACYAGLPLQTDRGGIRPRTRPEQDSDSGSLAGWTRQIGGEKWIEWIGNGHDLGYDSQKGYRHFEAKMFFGNGQK